MKLDVSSTPLSHFEVDLIAIPVFEGRLDEPGRFQEIDQSLNGRLTRLAELEGFEGKSEQLLVYNPDGKLGASRVMLYGMGPRAEFTPPDARLLGVAAIKAGRGCKAKTLGIAMPRAAKSKVDAVLEGIGCGVTLGEYSFDEFKSETKPSELEEVIVNSKELAGPRQRTARARLEWGATVGAATNRARDLVNGPANDVTPERLAKEAREIAKKHGLKVKIRNRAECEKLGMGLYLAVAQGASREPRFIHLQYEPAGKPVRTVALVGKGVTFDSGGLSIKPAKAMEEMKCDMAGGAAVISAMAAIAAAKPPVRVHAVCAATENMPSGDAYRPGDIFKGMSGRTVEVLNTDAEGRLTLADAIHFVNQEGVDEILEMSTLTGACIVALGKYTMAAMSKHEDMVKRVLSAAETAGEDMWRLPLVPRIAKELKSEIADCKNIGGGYGGAISAGHFLLPFAGDTPFVHLDIAGPAFGDGPWGVNPKGGTGIPVQTLVQYVTRTLPEKFGKKK